MYHTEQIIAAKRQLGIDRFALQIHDACFPADPGEDWGRGSPYSYGAERLFEFAAQLGFDTIQLGPQGMTQRGNPSPYDGTLFSRNPLNLPLARFVERGRITAQTLAGLCVSGRSESPSSSQLYDRFQTALAEIVASANEGDRAAARQFLADHELWLVPDALYGALCAEHATPWWRDWHVTPQGALDQRLFAPPPGQEDVAARRLISLRSQYSQRIEDYALIQWLLHVEHQALRARLQPLGLLLFADLQVGLADQDAWARQALFLDDYRMGAPPSRTNPDGQPWGYAVLDPQQLGTLSQPGRALEFVQARLRKCFSECDGIRIDHPHGWIDPWVYHHADPDPFHAVQNGARLFSSPRELLHPELMPLAIARTDQLDLSVPRYADQRVSDLDDSQVVRYSILIDSIVLQAQSRGQSSSAIACEVLSTLPYPIQRVLERHGLGRFRVVQKAKLDTQADVYRIENACPEDWIMLGTHDTPTIWELAARWTAGPEGKCWGDYLSELLAAEPNRPALATHIAASTGEVINSMFTAMLASRARQVAVFFPDLLGMSERYNQPGITAESNWRLRIPNDFAEMYEAGRAAGRVLDVFRCFDRAVHMPHGSRLAGGRLTAVLTDQTS